MKLRSAFLALAAFAPAACAQTPAPAPQPQSQPMAVSTAAAAPIIFFDIAGPDLAAQRTFYQNVFNWAGTGELYTGPMPKQDVTVPATGRAMKASLRADAPEKVIYIGVPDIAATLKKVTANGGRVEAERYELKGVVVMGMFYDPAGNRMGLVELDTNNQPKVP